MPPRPDLPLEAQRASSRPAVIRLVRMAFFILITTVALVTVIQRASDHGDLPSLTPTRLVTPERTAVAPARPVVQAPAAEVSTPWWLPVAIAVVLFGIVLLIDLATPNKKISAISAVIFGLLAGILVTVAISAIIELALRVWLSGPAYAAISPMVNIIKPLLGIALCYLGITTVLQTQDDFRLVIPYVEFAKQIRGVKPLILDTSALIDARIADVCASGLIQAPLIIPRFVVTELQTLADSSDKLKRARGRRGLEVIGRLQRQGTIDVSIDDTPVASLAVDQALVELAKSVTGRIVTTDSGLARVAQIHGVVVLNFHEIAQSFRPALIAGQNLAIRLVKPGEHPGQGVGYLDDGTMVVAEQAADMIGREAQVVVTGTIQTAAGRMVFAKLADQPPADPAGHPRPDGTQPDIAPSAADAGEISDAAPSPPTPEQAPDAPAEPAPVPTAVSAAASTPAAGPHPPKPPSRRPPSPRNPRR